MKAGLPYRKNAISFGFKGLEATQHDAKRHFRKLFTHELHRGTMAFHLYRHFDAEGNLLYVGVSLSTINRLGQHKDHSHWFEKIAKVTIQNFASREESLAAETEAIQTEKPLHNIQKTKAIFKIVEPEERSNVSLRSLDPLMRKVTFNPMYSVQAAAQCLDISTIMVRRLITSGKLGSFTVGELGKEKVYISGWQLIDFIEAAEKGKLNKAA